MADQQGFDLFGEHAVARDLDHLFEAAHEGQVAVGVDPAHVTGVDPALAQRLGGGFRLVPVAQKTAAALEHDLAGLAAGALNAAVGVDDADRHAGDRLAVAAPADGVARHVGVAGVGLRQAVSGLEALAVRGQLSPLPGQAFGEADAEAGDCVDAQAGEVELAGLGQCHAGDVHRCDAVPPAHSVAVDRLQHRQRVEAVEQHRRCAGVHSDVHAHQHAGDVVERCDRQQHIVCLHAVALGGGSGLEQRVVETQHRALGQPSGARGVGHQRDLVHRDHDRWTRSAAAADCEKVLAVGGQFARRGFHLQQFDRHIDAGLVLGIVGQQVGVVHDEHMGQRAGGTHLGHRAQQRCGRDDHTGLQVAELVGELMLFVQRAAGADHGAQLLDAEMRHRVLRTVGHEQRDRVAGADPQRRQSGSKSVARSVELGVADGPAVPKVGRLVGLTAGVSSQVLVQGQIGRASIFRVRWVHASSGLGSGLFSGQLRRPARSRC